MGDGSTDLDSLVEAQPSLCVPRSLVVPCKEDLLVIFRRAFGHENIHTVDVISRDDPRDRGRQYHRIFVHFTRWPRSERFDELRRRVLTGDSIKVVYEYPNFWKCFESKHPRQNHTLISSGVWLGGKVEPP